MPAKPPSMSASSRTWDALSRFWPTSGPGVVVICSAPTTSTMREAPAAIDFKPWCTAAEPVAQAFSTRVARLKRRSGEACSTSEAVKSCAEKPALKWPSTISSTSLAATPASASASLATRTIRLSTVSPESLPKGVWAQPTMQAVMIAPYPAFAEFPSLFLGFKLAAIHPDVTRIAGFAFAFDPPYRVDRYAPTPREPTLRSTERTATRACNDIASGADARHRFRLWRSGGPGRDAGLVGLLDPYRRRQRQGAARR